MIKPISISLSPNTEKDDIWLALKMIFQPWKWNPVRGYKGNKKAQSIQSSNGVEKGTAIEQSWKWNPVRGYKGNKKAQSIQSSNGVEKGTAIEQLENEFKRYLGVKYALSFNSGRSALMAILKALELEQGSEVLVQAFTCNAAVNPIIWSGFSPVYVDCNENDFNINIDDLKRKITLQRAQGKLPRVLMVQHTFGMPADMSKILDICRENNLILIEDCAHSLGAEYQGKKAGTFGNIAFFSFSRDKVISSVYGGMVATNNERLAEKIKQFQNEIKEPSYCWILQQLFHPILMNWLILPTYRILGKHLLVLFQWLKILSKAVLWKEKRGLKPNYFPGKMPNALAVLALNQFKKREKFNKYRKEMADFYYQELKNSSFVLPEIFPERKNIFLRFAVKHEQAHKIIRNAWKKNILIGDWYTSPVAPDDTKLEKLRYKPGSCQKAEKLSQITFNLPTHINISKSHARKIVDFLEKL